MPSKTNKIIFLITGNIYFLVTVAMASPLDLSSPASFPSPASMVPEPTLLLTTPTSINTISASPTSTDPAKSRGIFGWDTSVGIAFFIVIALVVITILTIIYLFIKRRRNGLRHQSHTTQHDHSRRDADLSSTETTGSSNLERPATAVSWLEILKGKTSTPVPPHAHENLQPAGVCPSAPEATHTTTGSGRGFWRPSRKPADIEAEMIEMEAGGAHRHKQPLAVSSPSISSGELKDEGSGTVLRKPTPMPILETSSQTEIVETKKVGIKNGEKILDMKSLAEMDALELEVKGHDAVREDAKAGDTLLP